MKQVKLQAEGAVFNEVDAAMISLNEEENIIPCVENIYSVVDDIIIIDGGSTDRTIPLLREFKQTKDRYDKIKLYKNDFWKSANGILGDQKNLAISKTDSLFCLFIDPDERLSEDLLKDFRKIIRDNQDKDLIDFYRFNFIDGEPEELDKEFQLRLFKSFCRYVGTSHHELVGWASTLRVELDEKYHMIHNKSSYRSKQNQQFFDIIDGKFPHKHIHTSRTIDYTIIEKE